MYGPQVDHESLKLYPGANGLNKVVAKCKCHAWDGDHVLGGTASGTFALESSLPGQYHPLDDGLTPCDYHSKSKES